MECCEQEGQCPMHAAANESVSPKMVTQAQGDACFALLDRAPLKPSITSHIAQSRSLLWRRLLQFFHRTSHGRRTAGKPSFRSPVVRFRDTFSSQRSSFSPFRLAVCSRARVRECMVVIGTLEPMIDIFLMPTP